MVTVNNALEVANYVIKFCIDHDAPISNPQLQKILYFIQKECLGRLDKPAFKDDIYAWKNGPTVVGVYREFSAYSSYPILRDAITINNPKIPKDIISIIDDVVAAKMKIPSWKLAEETHRLNSAWYKAYNGSVDRIISIDDIKSEFKEEYIMNDKLYVIGPDDKTEECKIVKETSENYVCIMFDHELSVPKSEMILFLKKHSPINETVWAFGKTKREAVEHWNKHIGKCIGYHLDRMKELSKMLRSDYE